ncbi:MFS transporter [Luteolibacter pohnpeiensis]|uniref:MFS transporter n=1 Tax=Luteolibacter pohnpeiensis TaxID=454153 RepID=A0A934VX12_9BACT|nr:MFS transporter [Luteolibacter pohnpeiensis]MBK1883084.1 MFS transporter [Luteolibacter pohnpeiensis]
MPRPVAMLARFSLYGFLKNLRFFDAFLLLALRERGIDFLGIGGLIAVREVASHLSQIPSGALADAFGRRRCMVVSMACYVISYLALGLSAQSWLLVFAMVFYGTADAFRDGTHKTLIYTWLRQQGRENERTKIYGYTRSWSKMGSALSSLIAAVLVFITGNFSTVFLLSAIPAFLNLINLATYPASLDAGIAPGGGLKQAYRHLVDGFKEVISRSSVRRLVMDSIAFEGGYPVVKDYLQIVVQASVIALPLGLSLSGEQRTAVFSGLSYAVLHFLASKASKSAHRFESSSGGVEPAIDRIFLLSIASMMILGLALVTGVGWLAISIFIFLGILQNLWRPIHIGRFDRDGNESRAATTLSIESQASSLVAAIWAPLIGFFIDRLSQGEKTAPLDALWPVTLVAIPLILAWVWRRFRGNPIANADIPRG